MLRKVVFVALIAASSLTSGCAVFMAAQKKGEEAKTIERCDTRNCFLALRDTTVVSRSQGADGVESITFRTQQQSGSAVRAVGHGVADVFTLGLWEVVGTPTEAIVNKNRYWVYTASFNESGRLIKLDFDRSVAPPSALAAGAAEKNGTKTTADVSAAPVEAAIAAPVEAPATAPATIPAEAEAPAEAAAPAPVEAAASTP